MVKVRKALTAQTRRSFGCRPSLTPKTGASASSTAEARAKRSATPANGGMPRSPTRITAQVVLQIRIRSARTAQVRARDDFTDLQVVLQIRIRSARTAQVRARDDFTDL